MTECLGLQAKSVGRRKDSSCDERQSLTRAGVVFPKVLEPAAEQRATNGRQVTGSLAAPQHARLFEPLADDGFAAGLHHARTNEIAGLAERLVHHVGPAALKVSDLLLGQLAGLCSGGQTLFGLSNDLGDFILEESLAPAAKVFFVIVGMPNAAVKESRDQMKGIARESDRDRVSRMWRNL
jgi:hypothetical protein